MATIITGISQTKVLSNLDTYNHTAMQASMYKVEVQMSENPPSGLTITIQQNGVTKASTSTPASSQAVVDLQVLLNCAPNDLISVILASSNAQEAAPNQIKGILKISVGQN